MAVMLLRSMMGMLRSERIDMHIPNMLAVGSMCSFADFMIH